MKDRLKEDLLDAYEQVLEDELSQKYDNLSLSELKSKIQALTTNYNTSHKLIEVTYAIGRYMLQLQKEFHYPPVFPLEFLPISKDEIKKWGIKYASETFKHSKKLMKYQQDGALCYTKFRSLTTDQWEAIRMDRVENLYSYYYEIEQKGNSSLEVASEFKLIIDNYFDDFKSEVMELQHQVRINSLKRGCLMTIIGLIIIGSLITWILIK